MFQLRRSRAHSTFSARPPGIFIRRNPRSRLILQRFHRRNIIQALQLVCRNLTYAAFTHTFSRRIWAMYQRKIVKFAKAWTLRKARHIRRTARLWDLRDEIFHFQVVLRNIRLPLVPQDVLLRLIIKYVKILVRHRDRRLPFLNKRQLPQLLPLIHLFNRLNVDLDTLLLLLILGLATWVLIPLINFRGIWHRVVQPRLVTWLDFDVVVEAGLEALGGLHLYYVGSCQLVQVWEAFLGVFPHHILLLGHLLFIILWLILLHHFGIGRRIHDRLNYLLLITHQFDLPLLFVFQEDFHFFVEPLQLQIVVLVFARDVVNRLWNTVHSFSYLLLFAFLPLFKFVYVIMQFFRNMKRYFRTATSFRILSLKLFTFA